MKINTKILDKKWFKFEDGDGKAEFLIRPFPFSNLKMSVDDAMEQFYHHFDYCLVDWRGLDEDGKPFKYNNTNKKLIFDFYEEVREFVFTKSKEMAAKVDKELKN